MPDDRLTTAASQLREALAATGQQLVEAAVADLRLPRRDVAAELDALRYQLAGVDLLSGGTAGRDPLCAAGQEIYLLLPYNITVASLWDILRLAAPGNRVRVRFSARAPRLARAVAQLVAELWPGTVLVDHRDRSAYLAAALAPGSPCAALFAYGGERLGTQLLRYQGPTKVVFEGPGKDPVVLLPGADVTAAAQAIAAAKFAYAGQQCIGPEIVAVHRSRYAEFTAAIGDRFARATVGDPTDPRTDVGPVASPAVASRFVDHVADAVRRGGRVLVGGQADEQYLTPAVIVDADPGMRVWQEESFAPVIAVAPVDSQEAAVASVTDTRFGLCCAIYGQGAEDLAAVLAGDDYAGPVDRLRSGRFGLVTTGRQPFSDPQDGLLPFGGYGVSGWIWDGHRLHQGPKCFAREAVRQPGVTPQGAARRRPGAPGGRLPPG